MAVGDPEQEGSVCEAEVGAGRALVHEGYKKENRGWGSSSAKGKDKEKENRKCKDFGLSK